MKWILTKEQLMEIYAEVSAARYPSFLPEPPDVESKVEAVELLYGWCLLVLTHEERRQAVFNRYKYRANRASS